MQPVGQEERPGKIIKDTTFFEPAKFQPFEKDIAIPIKKLKPETIDEIDIKCCGYGYFQEGNRKIQTQIKHNLVSYLRDAVRQCKGLKSFRLDFNGFSVEDRCLINIIEIVQEFARDKNTKEIIWIHTRFLRDCDKHTLEDMLELVDSLVRSNYEEVSVKMSAWQFKNGSLSFDELEPFFGNFARNLAPKPNSPLKRFKIDLSSWYMSNLECFQLLSKAIPHNELARKIQAQKVQEQSNRKKMPEMTEEQLMTSRDMIQRYLTNLDEKYKIENPIPGKGPKYIKADKQYETRKLQYIRGLLNQGIDREILRLIYTQARGMPEQHRINFAKIREAVQKEEADQQRRIQHNEQIKKLTNQMEKDISREFVKYPFDFIMAERVRAFHALCALFLEDLQKNLESLEQLELDMRNWNSQFQMKQLKKVLTRDFAQMNALKMIGNAVNQLLANAELNKYQEEDSKAKLKLSFLT